MPTLKIQVLYTGITFWSKRSGHDFNVTFLYNLVTTSRSFLYGNTTQQVLDLYKPSSGSEESPKIIILVPGESDGIKYKEDYAFIIPFLQARFPSYAFVNVNYRLNETKFVDQSQDIMQVVLFLRTIEEYKTANFGFIGSTKIEEGLQ